MMLFTHGLQNQVVRALDRFHPLPLLLVGLDSPRVALDRPAWEGGIIALSEQLIAAVIRTHGGVALAGHHVEVAVRNEPCVCCGTKTPTMQRG